MDMELRSIAVMAAIQQPPREDVHAQHMADAALIPRPARVTRRPRSRRFIGSAMIRFGGWLQPRPASPHNSPESPRQRTVVA